MTCRTNNVRPLKPRKEEKFILLKIPERKADEVIALLANSGHRVKVVPE
jgi:hypothetical protein